MLRSRHPRVLLASRRRLTGQRVLPAFLVLVVPHLAARAAAETHDAVLGADDVVVASLAGLVQTRLHTFTVRLALHVLLVLLRHPGPGLLLVPEDERTNYRPLALYIPKCSM